MEWYKMDKKALKEAGKNWIDKTVESAKRINKSLLDPFGVKDFVSDYKKSKRKGKRTKSRMAQRTGNKYMIDKGTTYVKPKKIKPKQKPAAPSGPADKKKPKLGGSVKLAKKYFKGGLV